MDAAEREGSMEPLKANWKYVDIRHQKNGQIRIFGPGEKYPASDHVANVLASGSNPEATAKFIVDACNAADLRPADKEDEGRVTGETSDGYHTFNELYEHRHSLFAAVCAAYDGWKSMLHDDGTMLDGWFIAGVMTPKGQATYHLPLELWAKFPATIIRRAPKWDGHTPDDVIQRIASLRVREPAPQPYWNYAAKPCSKCGHIHDGHDAYCAASELAQPEMSWKCKAQRTADPPQDCDWPTCGCDPHADKVIEALQESGKLAQPETGTVREPHGLGTCKPIFGKPGHEDHDKPHVRNDTCWGWTVLQSSGKRNNRSH